MPRGHFLLSSHKRKQKEPREHISRDPLRNSFLCAKMWFHKENRI